MQVSYCELHCISNFTFLRGASHPEELVERALALGYTGLAITDECSFAGAARAHLALRELREIDAPARNFRLLLGTEIRLADEHARPAPTLVLLAQSRHGYGNLSQLITLARRAATKGSYRLTMTDLETQRTLLDDCLALLVPAGPGGSPPAHDRRPIGAHAAAPPSPPWPTCSASRGAAGCRWQRPATCTCMCVGARSCRTC
jgi:error-prone DNA polymerase